MKRLFAALAAVCLCTAAHAQSGKVVKILVGFPPGQATDLVARILAERLGPALGETVIVENRPGQGGSVALAALAKSPPDGTTMMLSALASLVTNPHLYKSVGYDTLKDFEPIALVADLPLLLVVHPSVPARTLPELIAAKANPTSSRTRRRATGRSRISAWRTSSAARGSRSCTCPIRAAPAR
jgi:tripartite-type tricarboxylate transporter receptor subunit TctC